MKIVTLLQPTYVLMGHLSELRHPVEGPLSVSDAEAERLKENGLLVGEPEDAETKTPKKEKPAPSDDAETADLKKLTVQQLKDLAGTEKVDLGTATKEADIIAAILAHRKKQSSQA